jgi:hypothetical protein
LEVILIVPIFSTGVEIKTLTHDKKPAALVVLRFLYQEGYKDEKGMDKVQVFPVATILLPRVAAKAFMKQFFALMSKEDEHGGDLENL